MTRSFWLALACLAPSCKKAVAPPPDPLDVPIPMDAGVRHGVYANGMRWFVEPNGHPDDRVVFRLAIDVGSAQEDDDQQGLAHLLEHMAFNGTKSFPGNELVTYLESLGTRFGPHFNAHTSFDETVYKLMVPSNDPASMDTALKVLGEWACCIALDDGEIEAERGVVLEEWRRRLGPQSRIWDVTGPLIYEGAPHAERNPIGTEQSLKSFTPEAVKRFHRDWYRPERMAIIAVGDVDPDEMASRLEAAFGAWTAEGPARPRPASSLPDPSDSRYAVIADPEVTRTSVFVLGKRDAPEASTPRGYRDDLLRGVALEILGERLGEISRSPSPPWLGASSGPYPMMPGEGGDSASVSAVEGGALTAYEALLVELKRFSTHGVTEGELARAKASTLRDYESLLAELETTESVVHADELVRHVTEGESVPGTEREVEMARSWVPAFTVEEVNAVAAGWLAQPHRVVTLVLPEREGSAPPTVADLKAVEARVAAMEVAPPAAGADITALVDAAPAPGEVVERDTRFQDALGFVGLTFANGAKVWFKRTDFKADEIVMRAWRVGGHSAVPDADFVSALGAGTVRGASGLGAHDPNAITRFLAGKRAWVSASLSTYGGAMNGTIAPDDLDTALQLVHLEVTAPRFTDEGLELARTRWAAQLETRDKDPQNAYNDAWNLLNWPTDPRVRPLVVDDLARLERARAEATWREAFADPSDLTFLFVGNLPEDFEARVATWIGGLPANPRDLKLVDRGFRRADGDLRVTVEKGIEQKALFRMQFHGPFPDNTFENRHRLSSMADVLSVLLRERLREELSGVYSVGVGGSDQFRPENLYTVTIEFSCEPSRVAELEREAMAVIDRVRKEGVPASYVESEIKKNRQEREEALRTNGFWAAAFQTALDRGQDPLALLTWDQRNDALTPAVIQKAARDWLVDGRRATAVLLPAPKAD